MSIFHNIFKTEPSDAKMIRLLKKWYIDHKIVPVEKQMIIHALHENYERRIKEIEKKHDAEVKPLVERQNQLKKEADEMKKRQEKEYTAMGVQMMEMEYAILKGDNATIDQIREELEKSELSTP